MRLDQERNRLTLESKSGGWLRMSEEEGSGLIPTNRQLGRGFMNSVSSSWSGKAARSRGENLARRRGVVGGLLVMSLGLALAVPSMALGATWTVSSFSKLASENTAEAPAVSCTSTTFCDAVFSQNGQAPSSEQWNGTEWGPPSAIAAAPGNVVGLTCTSPTFCVAVGYRAGVPWVGTISTWDGTTWTTQNAPTPEEASRVELKSVSCVTKTECVAVGTYQSKATSVKYVLVDRLASGVWSSKVVPKVTGSGEISAQSVSCMTTGSCILVGYYISGGKYLPFAERGGPYGAWELLSGPPLPAGATDMKAEGISCRVLAPSNPCTLVGWAQNAAGERYPVAERWNGVNWSVQTTAMPLGVTGAEFKSVSCVNSTHCTAAGSTSTETGTKSLIESWNGSGWAIESTPNGPSGFASLRGISCTTETVCMAVGGTRASPLTASEPFALISH